MLRWIIDMFRRVRAERRNEWARVPPPEWAAKRGWGRNYW